jgi:hypothetical protein
MALQHSCCGLRRNLKAYRGQANEDGNLNQQC